jgi:hypothetical protein
MPELCHSLSEIAARWLDRRYPLRQEAVARAAPEFCLSAATFELALEWIFSHWTAANLRRLSAQHPFKDCRYAAQVLAGNTPAMIAQGFLQGAILNIPQVLKIPRRQTYFARLLQHSFAETDVKLAALFELHTGQEALTSFYARLAQADLVLVYGEDQTVATLKKYLAPDAIFIGHGHAESAALIFKEAANRQHLEKLAYDMLSYDQRGCLSPRVTCIEQGGEYSPADCARLFATEILPTIAQQFPRGGLFPGEAAEILHRRNVYGFRGTVYAGSDWTVCYDEALTWPEEALPRFMPFKPFATLQQLKTILHPLQNRLSTLGYAGPATRLASWMTSVVPVGEMQKQLLIF